MYRTSLSLEYSLVSIDLETVAKLAELDMVVAELERANNRAASAERRNVRLSLYPVTGQVLNFS